MDKFEDATLLIVDDESFLRKVLVARLQDFGARILEAENGEEALKLIKTEVIDAVLTDIVMPKMDGLELLAKIREMGLMTPVVILTGVGDQTRALTALRLGASDFLDKPFESSVVREVMSRALKLGIASRLLGSKEISADEFRRQKAELLSETKKKS